jgi:aminopeptidase N
MGLLNANSYQKGGWVLHMLRRELGDSVFHTAIRKYYAAYAGKNADTKDLQKVFETASGKNLEQFFKQWLYTAENLKLDIKWKYNAKAKKVYLTITQLQPAAFSFSIGMKFVSNGKNNLPVPILNVSRKTETFSYNVSDNFVNIIPDPMVSLLAEIFISQEK